LKGEGFAIYDLRFTIERLQNRKSKIQNSKFPSAFILSGGRPVTRIGTRFILIGAGVLLALAVPSVRLLAQGASGEMDIYGGGSPQAAGISIQSWGSGEAKESDDYVYSGNRSIRIITQGRYQGARLVLSKPADLKTAMQDPNAYLQFLLVLPDQVSGGRLGGYQGYEGGYPGMGRGGIPGMGGRGGYPGMGGRGGPGGYGDTGTRMVKPRPLSSLRVVLVTEDNKHIETTLDMDSSHRDREDWTSLAIPVAAIPGLKDTDGQVKEIQIFGDSPSVMYLGEVRIIRDETPIRVDMLEERTIAKNDTINFIASADGGTTPLKYEWKIQGIPKPEEKTEVTKNYVVMAEGRTFKHRFRRNGDYLVTLTVSDKYGLKKPATTSVNIHVTL
jgi:hypothetical protein